MIKFQNGLDFEIGKLYQALKIVSNNREDIITCQEALIDAGLKDYAEL